MGSATIYVNGAYARLQGVPGPEGSLDCLSVDHPKKDHIQAYRDDRWDGKVHLNDGMKFPAGLLDFVRTNLVEDGHEVQVTTRGGEPEPIDLSRFDDKYLPGITLYDHQMRACLALLKNVRGVVKSPTGSGKTEIIIACARMFWEERGWRSLVVLPKRGLCTQTIQRFEKYYGSDLEIGQMGDGIKTTGDIVVGTAQTLIGFKSRRKKQRGARFKATIPPDPLIRDVVENFEVLWLDECHHSSAETWYEIALASKAKRRYGTSGTPLKAQELADLRMMGVTGGIIHEVATTKLIDKGLTAKPKIAMIMSENASGPDLELWEWTYRTVRGEPQRYKKNKPYSDAYDIAIVNNKYHNRSVVRATEWFVDQGLQTLVLCRRKEHWKILRRMIRKTGISFLSVWGATDTEVREQVKHEFANEQVQCVLASTIWDEGEDVPAIRAIALAEGVQATTNVLQRIGRGMRPKEGGRNEVLVADFVPTCWPKGWEHAESRAATYEAEGYEVRVVQSWPKFNDKGDHPDLLPFKEWD